MDFVTKITQIGELVEEFLTEKLLIVFNDNAPPGLAEISVLHTIEEFTREVSVGDMVYFGKSAYEVTAVGDEANKTLESMGHCSFSFTGENQAKLPGQIEVKGQSMPTLKVGDVFSITYQEN